MNGENPNLQISRTPHVLGACSFLRRMVLPSDAQRRRLRSPAARAGTTLPRTAAGCARPPPRHAWILQRCPPRPVDPADRAAVLAGEGDVRAPARISFGHGKEGGIRGFGRRRRRGLGGIERRNWGSISREGTRSSCPAEDFFTEWDPPYLCFLGEPL